MGGERVCKGAGAERWTDVETASTVELSTVRGAAGLPLLRMTRDRSSIHCGAELRVSKGGWGVREGQGSNIEA